MDRTQGQIELVQCSGRRAGSYLSLDVLERLVMHRVPTVLSFNDLIAAARLPWSEQAKVVFG